MHSADYDYPADICFRTLVHAQVGVDTIGLHANVVHKSAVTWTVPEPEGKTDVYFQHSALSSAYGLPSGPNARITGAYTVVRAQVLATQGWCVE